MGAVRMRVQTRDAPNIRPKIAKKTLGVRLNKRKDNNIYRTMMRRDQTEAHTNAANMTAVWKHLKLSEKDAKIITSTDRERLFSAAFASHVSDEKKRQYNNYNSSINTFIITLTQCSNWDL